MYLCVNLTWRILTEGFLCLLANNAVTAVAEFGGRLASVVIYQLCSHYCGGFSPLPASDHGGLSYRYVLNESDQCSLAKLPSIS